MCGWFFLILSRMAFGSGKGSVQSRCSAFLSGPPPMVRVDASRARRETAIAWLERASRPSGIR